MNHTPIELKIGEGVVGLMNHKRVPAPTFETVVEAVVGYAREEGILPPNWRVRVFFSVKTGQIYVDVRAEKKVVRVVRRRRVE